MTANKPDEKAKCFVWAAVSWVTLSDQTGETGTCLLSSGWESCKGRGRGCHYDPAPDPRAESIRNTSRVWHGAGEGQDPAQHPGVLSLGTAVIPPSGGMPKEEKVKSWWMPSATTSVAGLSSVLPIRATGLCLHCRECSLLCPAAELHVLQVMT